MSLDSINRFKNSWAKAFPEEFLSLKVCKCSYFTVVCFGGIGGFTHYCLLRVLGLWLILPFWGGLVVISFTGVFGKKPNIMLFERSLLFDDFILELWEIPNHWCDFSSMVSFVIFMVLYRIASSNHLLAKPKDLVSFSCGRFPIPLIIPILSCSFLDLWYHFWDGLTRTAFFCDVGTWGF